MGTKTLKDCDKDSIIAMIIIASSVQLFCNIVYGKRTFDAVEELDLNLREQGGED